MPLEDYRAALKKGQKELRTLEAAGENPYLPALEELVPGFSSLSEVPLGVESIPLELIVGTRAAGRSTSFTRSFRPLLNDRSEFAAKWISLSDYHLAEGIQEPIIVIEYLQRYYVVEGHKRVSVLQYYGAPTVMARVTRVMPRGVDGEEYRVYREYLEFYRLTRVNCLQYHDEGKFARLLKLLGPDFEQPWDEERRRDFTSELTRFRRVLAGVEQVSELDRDEVLLRYLRLYSYERMKDRTEKGLQEDLSAIVSELRSEVQNEEPELLLEPEEKTPQPKGLLSRLLTPESEKPPKTLKVAFLHDKTAYTSYWTFSHEQGRREVQELFGDRIETKSFYNLLRVNAAERIRAIAEEGYQLVFTTTPRLLDITLKAAAEYPDIRFLNCSLNIGHPILRTYYGRMYEAKYLAGVLAGAMSENGRIGYLGNYPIYGMPASINAFAMGAQLANPTAQVFLEWNTVPGVDPDERFRWNDVRAVSGMDISFARGDRQDFGVYLPEYGRPRNVGKVTWNWGEYYRRIIGSVLDGSWSTLDDKEDSGKAINYWWGLSTGVIGVEFSDGLPPQTRRLLALLKKSICSGEFHPLQGPIYDQTGRLRIAEGMIPSPRELLEIDWLASNVTGSIPPADILTPEAADLVRVQGVLRQDKDELV